VLQRAEAAMGKALASETTGKSRRLPTDTRQPSCAAMDHDVTDLEERSVFCYEVR